MIGVTSVTICSFCVVASVALGQSPGASRQPPPALQSLTEALEGTWFTVYAFAPETPAVSGGPRLHEIGGQKCTLGPDPAGG